MSTRDTRSNEEALIGLLGIEDQIRKGLQASGVQSGAAPAAAPAAAAPEAPSAPGLTMPTTWQQDAYKKDGGLKFTGKAFLNDMTGGWLQSAIFPESVNGNAGYKTDMAVYAALKAEEQKRALVQGDIDLINNGVNDAGDALARANILALDGVKSPEDATWVLKGGQPKIKPDYVTVENNGQKYMIDKNNPSSPGIPLTTPDGKPIRSALPQWAVDNIGAFDRMVPRLQELDEMELAGMAIPRSTMTQLRAYEKQDSSGQNVIVASAFGEWMNSYLTPLQRKYILAAEDAGMVVLRDESGAAISSDEILRQMNQYLMFDDLDGDTRAAQRGARTRKAGTLMTGVPDYIKNDRKDQLDWVENYDPSVVVEGINPMMTTGSDKLPPMTAADMATYLKLSKRDPKLGAQFLGLIGGTE